MCILSRKPGVTILELIIYIGLLAFIAQLLFSFALQIVGNNKKILSDHIAMSSIQLARDLIIKDILDSSALRIDASSPIKMSCDIGDAIIEWKVEKNSLFRVCKKDGKKPVISKVADKISVLRLHKNIDKYGQELISMQLLMAIPQEQSFVKLIIRRNTLIL